MKRHIARNILLAKFAALALLCFARQPVSAQHSGTHALYQDFLIPPIGLAPLQSLSLTFFNPNGTPVRAQAQVHNAVGMQVALGDGSVRFLSASIQAGAFYSFKINYDEIRLPGDESTGRKQILVSASLTFSEAIKPVVASVETIDVRDGTSNTVFAGEIPSPQAGGDGNDTIKSGFVNDIMMGIPPGHILLVTILNPRSSGSDYLPSRVILYESNGGPIAQSPELVIPSGEFRLFKFNPNEIPLSGEPGANRALVRIKPFFRFESERLSRVLASVEIVNISTGKTMSYTGYNPFITVDYQ